MVGRGLGSIFDSTGATVGQVSPTSIAAWLAGQYATFDPCALSPGQQAALGVTTYNVQGGCADVQQMKTPPAVPGPQTEAQMTQPGGWTPDMALAAQLAAWKQQNVNFFAGLPGVDCKNWWTYLTNSSCPTDCTMPLSTLINPKDCWNWTYVALIGGGVLVALLLVARIVK
jgi:hypothetical protein